MLETRLRQSSPAILTLSGILLFFSLYITGSTWPLYLHKQGFDTGAIGLIMGVYGFTLIFSRIPIGMLADSSHGKRKILIAIGFVSIALGMLLALTKIPVFLVSGRILMGIGAAFYVPIVILYSAFYPASSLTRSMGRTASFFGIGQVLAIPLGAFLTQYFGYESAFWLSSIFALLGAFLILLIHEPKIGSAGALVMPPAKKDLFVSSILMAACFFVVFATAYALTPLYADITLKVSAAVQGTLMTVYLIVFVAIVLESYRLVEKFGGLSVAAVGLAALGIGALLTPVADLPLLFISELLLGIGLGLTWAPLMAMSVRNIEPKLRFGAMGIFQSIYAVGMFFGPAISGQVAKLSSIGTAFYLNAFVAFIAFSYIIISYTTKKVMSQDVV